MITVEDHWAPRGFLQAEEAKLGETAGFLSELNRAEITDWWLARRRSAETPNWDLVSTCRIENDAGLLLIEAKAHEGELADDECGAKNSENVQQIALALEEANVAWNRLTPGFALSAGSHYQLSNRFAFAWKVAQMGTPVVLLYLGFLNAQEMEAGRRLCLKDHSQWRHCLLARSKGTIPESVWDMTFDVKGVPLTVLIGSAVVDIHVRSESGRSRV